MFNNGFVRTLCIVFIISIGCDDYSNLNLYGGKNESQEIYLHKIIIGPFRLKLFVEDK